MTLTMFLFLRESIHLFSLSISVWDLNGIINEYIKNNNFSRFLPSHNETIMLKHKSVPTYIVGIIVHNILCFRFSLSSCSSCSFFTSHIRSLSFLLLFFVLGIHKSRLL